MSVSNPEEFVKDPMAVDAVATAIAHAANVSKDYVEVELTIGSRRLDLDSLNVVPRRLSGTVNVAYVITLPEVAGSDFSNFDAAAGAVKTSLQSVTPALMSSLIVTNLGTSRSYSVTVETISDPVIDVQVVDVQLATTSTTMHRSFVSVVEGGDTASVVVPAVAISIVLLIGMISAGVFARNRMKRKASALLREGEDNPFFGFAPCLPDSSPHL